jgi:hypothetical protein
MSCGIYENMQSTKFAAQRSGRQLSQSRDSLATISTPDVGNDSIGWKNWD